MSGANGGLAPQSGQVAVAVPGRPVNCEVTGFVLAADGVPTVYVSGDNASIGVVAEVARRVGPIEVAVLFIGAARVPTKERGRPLTRTSERAAAPPPSSGPLLSYPRTTTGGRISARAWGGSSRRSTRPGSPMSCGPRTRAAGPSADRSRRPAGRGLDRRTRGSGAWTARPEHATARVLEQQVQAAWARGETACRT